MYEWYPATTRNWLPAHLRAPVARLTAAVSIEGITAGAVVALAFLFTTLTITARGARVGADEALEKMFWNFLK